MKNPQSLDSYDTEDDLNNLLIGARQREGKVRFYLPEEQTDASVVGIYGQDGSLVREWETSGNVVECDVPGVPSGIYLARLSCAGFEQTLHLQL